MKNTVVVFTSLLLDVELERDNFPIMAPRSTQYLTVRARLTTSLPGPRKDFVSRWAVMEDEFQQAPDRAVEQAVESVMQPVIEQLTEQLKDLYVENCHRHGGRFI